MLFGFSFDALTFQCRQIALGGLPDKMRVEVDPNIRVSAKTVGELLLLEGHFGAGQKAHCHIRFSDDRETPRRGLPSMCCEQPGWLSFSLKSPHDDGDHMSPCDGQSRHDQRADKPPLSLIEPAARFALCIAIRATVACKKDMPNGHQNSSTVHSTASRSASCATGTSWLGAARFSKLRGRLHGLLEGAREDLTWIL
jgi:hypothetical protein